MHILLFFSVGGSTMVLFREHPQKKHWFKRVATGSKGVNVLLFLVVQSGHQQLTKKTQLVLATFVTALISCVLHEITINDRIGKGKVSCSHNVRLLLGMITK